MIKRMLFVLLTLCAPFLAMQAQAVIQVNTEGQKPTYSYQGADLVPAATATDLVRISGAAGKIIRINRIQITADATDNSHVDLYVFKRSAANTGGTSSLGAIAKLDSANPTASAVVTVYSANPTALGAGVLLAGDHYQIPAKGTGQFHAPPWIEDFGDRNGQQIVLRGASESICVGLNGQTLPAGLTLYIRIEWTEE
jgi:hypothetical protein